MHSTWARASFARVTRRAKRVASHLLISKSDVPFGPMILIERIGSNVETLLVLVPFRVDDSRMVAKSWLSSQSLHREVRGLKRAIHSDELHVFFPIRKDMQMLDNEYRFHVARVR